MHKLPQIVWITDVILCFVLFLIVCCFVFLFLVQLCLASCLYLAKMIRKKHCACIRSFVIIIEMDKQCTQMDSYFTGNICPVFVSAVLILPWMN